MKIFILSHLFSLSLFLNAQNDTSNCINNVTGKVVNKQTKSHISNALIQLKLNGKVVEELHTDSNGTFTFSLDCEARYQISAVYENFSKSIKLVYTTNTQNNHDVLMEMIPLNEFKVVNDKKMIAIEPIEFEPDDYSVTKEIAAQLDFVFELLNKYNNLQIEIAFHSNNMGEFEFLKSLTQKRADVCANYIINKGISSSRIVSKGYGFSAPISDCNNEEMKENKKRCLNNLRTEFIVTSDIIE
jgi:outer membrane protein OmpA-like peptidoglycan-associated protein